MSKVILSRKGFDSTYGGHASPIMPNGDLVSLPIPTSTKSGREEKGIPYSELKYHSHAYSELMSSLGIKTTSHLCHLDPDLVDGIRPREKGWTGVFGQQGSAHTYLKNQEVGAGDIFLFFGSFKRTVRGNKIVAFESDYPRHVIFGFLKVGRVMDLTRETILDTAFHYHPHFQNKNLYKERNSLFFAQDDESYGTFKFNENLVLTREGFPRSFWELPLAFDPKKDYAISGMKKENMSCDGKSVYVQSTAQCQEFVINGNQEVFEWASELICNSK